MGSLVIHEGMKEQPILIPHIYEGYHGYKLLLVGGLRSARVPKLALILIDLERLKNRMATQKSTDFHNHVRGT